MVDGDAALINHCRTAYRLPDKPAFFFLFFSFSFSFSFPLPFLFLFLHS